MTTDEQWLSIGPYTEDIMSAPNSQRKITRKDGTYFIVDADSKISDDDLTVYAPDRQQRVLRTWTNSYGDITAFCWLQDFLSDQFLP